MTGKLVLITGGTGFVGHACVLHALRAGYRVRLAIRKEADRSKFNVAPELRDQSKDIEYVIVEDMTKDKAFDSAVKGVDFVVHVASPIPDPAMSEPFEESLIKPAVKGTLGILGSAAKEAGIKRVVITSSVTVVMSDEEGKVFDETTIGLLPSGPFHSVYEAYHVAKVLAHRASRDFMVTHKPRFSLVRIMPSFVLGCHALATSTSYLTSPACTNSILLSPLLGGKFPFPVAGGTVHVDDVARAHIQSLNATMDGDQDFVLSAGGIDGVKWSDAAKIAQSRFGKEVKEGKLPLNGTIETKLVKVDATKAERFFEFRYKSFEEQVVDVVGQYLELHEQKEVETA